MATYFGSTLTDAQRAMTEGDRLSLDQDNARRQMLANAIANRQRGQALNQQDSQFNRELALRGREADQRGNSQQMMQLLNALALALEQKRAEDQMGLTREGFESLEKRTAMQFPPGYQERFAPNVLEELLKVTSRDDQNAQDQNAVVDQGNAISTAKAANLNALVDLLKQKAQAEGSRPLWFGDSSNKVFQAGWPAILQQSAPGVDGAIVQPGPNNTFNPVLMPRRTNSNNNISSVLSAMRSRSAAPQITNSLPVDPRVTAIIDALQMRNVGAPSVNAPAPAFGNYTNGQVIYDRAGRAYRVVNGQPIPIQTGP